MGEQPWNRFMYYICWPTFPIPSSSMKPQKIHGANLSKSRFSEVDTMPMDVHVEDEGREHIPTETSEAWIQHKISHHRTWISFVFFGGLISMLKISWFFQGVHRFAFQCPWQGARLPFRSSQHAINSSFCQQGDQGPSPQEQSWGVYGV